MRTGVKGVSALCLGVLLAACRDDDAPSPPDEAFVAPSTAAPGAEGSFSETDADVAGGGGTSGRRDGGSTDAEPGAGDAGLGAGNPGPGRDASAGPGRDASAGPGRDASAGPGRDASAGPDASPPTGTGFGRDAQVDAAP